MANLTGSRGALGTLRVGGHGICTMMRRAADRFSGSIVAVFKIWREEKRVKRPGLFTRSTKRENFGDLAAGDCGDCGECGAADAALDRARALVVRGGGDLGQ